MAARSPTLLPLVLAILCSLMLVPETALSIVAIKSVGFESKDHGSYRIAEVVSQINVTTGKAVCEIPIRTQAIKCPVRKKD